MKKAQPLLSASDVIRLVSVRLRLKKLSRASLYNWIRTRNFPAPTEFGIPRNWRRAEVETWIEKQINQSKRA